MRFLDDLDRYIKTRDNKSPGFAKKVKATYQRRFIMKICVKLRWFALGALVTSGALQFFIPFSASLAVWAVFNGIVLLVGFWKYQ